MERSETVCCCGGDGGRVLTQRTAAPASCPERPRSTSAPRTQNCDLPTQRAHAPRPPRTGAHPLRSFPPTLPGPRSVLRGPHRVTEGQTGWPRTSTPGEETDPEERGRRCVRGTGSGEGAGDDGTSTTRDQHQSRTGLRSATRSQKNGGGPRKKRCTRQLLRWS